MKLAILGSTPIALEAAVRFHAHGAALTWFKGTDEDVYPLFTSATFAPLDFTSETGLALLQSIDKKYSPKVFSWNEWQEFYAAPLEQYLRSEQKVRNQQVVSITKRYLAPQESIAGKTRFHDLFRVIFLVNPKEFIEQQKEADPEKYQKLTSEFVGSLQSTIEMFEDFDMVLDCRLPLERGSLAISGRALGEGRVSSDKLISGLMVLKHPELIKDSAEVREIALIGSEALAAEVLLKLGDWITDPRSRIFLITTESQPFAAFEAKAHPETKKAFLHFMQGVEERLEKDFNQFHQKLREWQELDDFVQVKMPKPVEPIPQLNFFSGHNATAIDELIDRKRLFLTLEKPDFREGLKHPENNRVELKTLGVDMVLVANPMKRQNIAQHLGPKEPGYFSLDVELPTVSDFWQKENELLKGIEDEVFKLFSPVDHH